MIFRKNFNALPTQRKRAGLAGIVVLSALVAACGGGGSAASSPSPTSSSSSTTTTPVGSTPGTASVGTQWGTVAEPALPGTVCATLAATLSPSNGSLDAVDTNTANSQPDAARIQTAINACPVGQAVKLAKGAAGESGFLSGPLTLKSGVTLWVDTGVTLFASRNPLDYDNGAGNCGTADNSGAKTCKTLLTASNTTNSGIVGDGIIDGRGGSLLTAGANAGVKSWWDVAYQSKSGLTQHCPRMLEVLNGSSFTLYRITLQNSPNFHIVPSAVTGVTAWEIKILSPSLVYTQANYACATGTTPDVLTPATCFTPDTVKNTDGFDPAQSTKVLLAYSYISTGDDDVAVKSGGGASKNLMFAHNHFHYGHGMSIGSETNGSLSNLVVNDLAMDGNDSANGNGLRIKSDSSRGGNVDTVTYSQICMRNVRRPLVFDPFYSTSTGSLYPHYTNITIRDYHNLGSTKYGGAKQLLTFEGYALNGQNNPMTITLDNVVFDGVQPAFEFALASTHFTLGPGVVSFASSITASVASDVTVSGASGSSTAVDCSAAFVPLSSVLATSPI
jgi:polygalacturonase